jgi:hypothetical protein
MKSLVRTFASAMPLAVGQGDGVYCQIAGNKAIRRQVEFGDGKNFGE